MLSEMVYFLKFSWVILNRPLIVKCDVQTHWASTDMLCIGGSRGGMPGAHHPLWDPILLFLHTFSPKSARIGGARPPYEKSWIRHCCVCVDLNFHIFMLLNPKVPIKYVSRIINNLIHHMFNNISSRSK